MSETPGSGSDKEPGNNAPPLYGDSPPPEYNEIDLFHPLIMRLVEKKGRYFVRRPRPITGFRLPTQAEIVQTVIDGSIEASRKALPGKHVIVTGIANESYALSVERFDELYDVSPEGVAIPKERRVLALPNPFNRPIIIPAPWSTPEDPRSMIGGPDAMLVFTLDEENNLTDDRYLVQTQELFEETYSPARAWGQSAEDELEPGAPTAPTDS